MPAPHSTSHILARPTAGHWPDRRAMRLLTAAPLLLFLASPAEAFAAPPAAPNIVLIMADDLGFSDLGCYGGEIRTPHLDQLAKQGLRMRQFYNCSKCEATRASLLTGRYEQQVAVMAMQRSVTIAEVLGDAGYRTMMVGKWHAAGHPMDRGFDRYFGFLGGASDFFLPDDRYRLDREKFTSPGKDFYTTDTFTDYALEFLDEAAGKQQPFFLYVAHNAPHYPLQCWPEEIARYRGKYRVGWDELRQTRHARQRALGLIDDRWPLSPRDPSVKAWETLSEKEQDEQDHLMAVYAAMVDRLDQNIGRLLARLDKLGVAENTLVMFCSDNGGCPWQNEEKPNEPPGPGGSHRTYNAPWANVSNTPLRWYKRFDHEGGIRTPMIVRWPAKIKQTGGYHDQVGHVIDLLATCAQAAGANYPAERAGKVIPPTEGIPLAEHWQAEPARRPKPLYWQFSKYRAVRDGDMKLVTLDSGKHWELYDLAADPTESRDLAKTDPDQVQRLAALWDTWSQRVAEAKAGKRPRPR